MRQLAGKEKGGDVHCFHSIKPNGATASKSRHASSALLLLLHQTAGAKWVVLVMLPALDAKKHSQTFMCGMIITSQSRLAHPGSIYIAKD